MKGLIFALVVIISINAIAQNNTAANIIEGGKTLVELVRVFKMPRYTMSLQPVVEKKDSCAIKNVTDLLLKIQRKSPYW